MSDFEAGQVYSVGTQRSVWWRVVSVNDNDTITAERVRKHDGETWVFDRAGQTRDFKLDIIREAWTLIGSTR